MRAAGARIDFDGDDIWQREGMLSHTSRLGVSQAMMDLAAAALPYVAWRSHWMERVMGIEPTLAAWEAAVLPLNYTRTE